MATKKAPPAKSTKIEPQSTPAKAAPTKAAAITEKVTTTKAANINPAPKSTTKETTATETKPTTEKAAVAAKEPVKIEKQESISAVEAKKTKIDKSAITAEHIAVRAYLLWQERGFSDGGDVNDWLRAEAELNSLN